MKNEVKGKVAEIMKFKNFSYGLLTIILVLIFSACTKKKAEIIKGTFTYMPAFSLAKDDVFYYSDDYFMQSGKIENEHLITMSLALELSTFQVESDTWVRSVFEQIGFKDIVTYDMDGFKPQADSIGTAIAHKKIDGHEVVAVAIRGEKYGKEWEQNFWVGESGDASGFADASVKVRDRLLKYISDLGAKDVKIWIVGYSRSASVADLTGVHINKNLDLYKTAADDVYIFGFETPACSEDTTIYENIYDVINPNDFIPNFYPEDWGLHKNGKRIEICETVTIKTYFGLTGSAELDETDTGLFGKSTVNFLAGSLSREDYAQNVQGPLGKVFSIIFSKSDEDKDRCFKFFENELANAAKEYLENESVQTSIQSIFFHKFNRLYDKTGGFAIDILELARSKSTDFPFTDEEYETLKSNIIPLIRGLGPVITDDYFYLPEMTPEEYYKAYAPDSLLSESELAVKYGSDMGEKTGYSDVFYDEEYDSKPDYIDDYGAEYEAAYIKAYEESYKEGYELGLYHKEHLAEKAKIDGTKDGTDTGFAAGRDGDDFVPNNEYFWFDDSWMTEEYVEEYNKAYEKAYTTAYEEGKNSPERDLGLTLYSLYHFRTIVENAKTLISYHYPQVNLAHIQGRDSYYTEIK